MDQQRRKRRTGGKHENLRRLAYTLGGLAALLFVLAVAGYACFRSKLGLLQRGTDPAGAHTHPGASIGAAGDDAAIAEAVDGLEEKDAVQAEGEVVDDDARFLILLIGTDERSRAFSANARGDVCMLLSIHKKSGSISLVSFERGMGVPVLAGRYEGQYDWLTHTFRYGGAELMLKEIRECFKVDVNRYVRVNFHTFAQGIDAIGGVDIELTQAEADALNGKTSSWTIADKTVYAGMNHLNGYSALQYSRLRQVDSDWVRIQRQRKVIQAALKQVRQQNWLAWNDALDQVLPLICTNLTDAEIAELLFLAPKCLGGSVQQMTIPEKGTYGSMTGMGGRRMFAVDFQQNAELLDAFLHKAEGEG